MRAAFRPIPALPRFCFLLCPALLSHVRGGEGGSSRRAFAIQNVYICKVDYKYRVCDACVPGVVFGVHKSPCSRMESTHCGGRYISNKTNPLAEIIPAHCWRVPRKIHTPQQRLASLLPLSVTIVASINYGRT